MLCHNQDRQNPMLVQIREQLVYLERGAGHRESIAQSTGFDYSRSLVEPAVRLGERSKREETVRAAPRFGGAARSA
jgi:hypothetical protein